MGIPDPGQWRHSPSHVIDILPTVLELTEGSYPETMGGKEILSPQGRSFSSLLTDTKIDPRGTPLFWEHEGNTAVRYGNWKLVRVGGKGRWELYDLEADRPEQNNLAASHPDKASRMAKMWKQWTQENNVAPNGNPGQ